MCPERDGAYFYFCQKEGDLRIELAKAEKVDNAILALTYEVFTLSELSKIIESMMVLIMVMVILQYNNYNKEETLQR